MADALHGPPLQPPDADIVEALQRAVIASLVEAFSIGSAGQFWAPMERLDAACAGHYPAGAFLFDTLDGAIAAMDGPTFCETRHVDQEEWETAGGARAYIHDWMLGLNDVLMRIRWIRDHIRFAPPEPRAYAIQRVRTYGLPPGVAQIEQRCCALRALLHQAQSSHGAFLFTAAFWRALGAIQPADLDTRFWEVWWAFAAQWMDYLGDDETRYHRALELLLPAARELYLEQADDCMDEIRVMHLEEDETMETHTFSPLFREAMEALGIPIMGIAAAAAAADGQRRVPLHDAE
jgi:hypothetical protein